MTSSIELGKEMSSLRIEEKKENTQNLSLQRNKLFYLVHRDDIHGIIKIAQNRFISGSKDGALISWKYDEEKNLEKQIIKKGQLNYKFWITALADLQDGLFAYGTRDGKINFCNYQDIKNEPTVREIKYSPKIKNISKDRNKRRINCITAVPNSEYFYTGTPCFIQRWSYLTGKMIEYIKAHDNDWVYCIDILKNKKLLVVIGSDLEIWETTLHSRDSLIKEENSKYKKQRPHISSITTLDADQNQVVSALFDGSIKVVDINAQKVFKDYKEHIGRVWSVVKINDNNFASSADDKVIKIWDIRQPKAVFSSEKSNGRVSCLMLLSDDILVSGSCPDRADDSKEKGTFSFWEIRKR